MYFFPRFLPSLSIRWPTKLGAKMLKGLSSVNFLSLAFLCTISRTDWQATEVPSGVQRVVTDFSAAPSFSWRWPSILDWWYSGWRHLLFPQWLLSWARARRHGASHTASAWTLTLQTPASLSPSARTHGDLGAAASGSAGQPSRLRCGPFLAWRSPTGIHSVCLKVI